MKNPTRILVVRFSSIGDIVLCTPAVRALKEQLEGEVQVDFITKKSFASIVESNPYIDNVITIDSHVSEIADFLGDQLYDYVIDFHNNIRSRQVKRATKSLAFTIDKRNFAKWVYVNTKKQWLPIGHVVERNLETIAALGIKDDGKGLDYFIPAEQEVSLNVMPEAFRNGYVAYAIGGLMEGKILPSDKIIALCNMIEAPIVLLGGKEDQERAARIIAECGSNVFSACGQFSLHQSASLIKQSNCVISHDTGLMHIASALKKRVISLWLATTPEIGMSPWRPGQESEMVEANCKKRPTSKLGNRGYQDKCVFNIDLERIARLVRR